MSNNLTINDSSVEKIVTVLKYVTINFNDQTNYKTTQIPGTPLEKKFINIKKVSQSTDYITYKIHFNWINNGVSAPLLVPSIDTTYTSEYCNMQVVNKTVEILYNNNAQNQYTDFYIISSEPLYFTGKTFDGAVLKTIKVTNNITIFDTNKYKMNLAFFINGLGTLDNTKSFNGIISVYKDYACEKYLGDITININVITNTGPGE